MCDLASLNRCKAVCVQVNGSDDWSPWTVSSNGVTNLDIAGVAMCNVLYNPMNEGICLTFVMCSSFVFSSELLL